MTGYISVLDDFIDKCRSNHAVKGKNYGALSRVLEKSPQVVIAYGQKGIGKTYLANQINHDLTNTHFLCGSPGTTLYNFSKFISTQLGIDLTYQRDESLDRVSHLISALSTVHSNHTFIIDDVEKLPANTLSAIIQIADSRPCLQFVLFCSSNMIGEIDKQFATHHDTTTIELQPLNDTEIKQMAQRHIDTTLSKRQLVAIRSKTQGIPKLIEQFIFSDGHYQTHQTKTFSWTFLYKVTKVIFYCAILFGSMFFTWKHLDVIKNTHIIQSIKTYFYKPKTSKIIPTVATAPKLSLPAKAEELPNTQQIKQTFMPLYTIQILGVHKPSSLQRIDKSLSKLSPSPMFIRKKDSEGNPWYVLYYGPFFTKEDARKALSKLPEELKHYNPWLRQVQAEEIIQS